MGKDRYQDRDAWSPRPGRRSPYGLESSVAPEDEEPTSEERAWMKGWAAEVVRATSQQPSRRFQRLLEARSGAERSDRLPLSTDDIPSRRQRSAGPLTRSRRHSPPAQSVRRKLSQTRGGQSTRRSIPIAQADDLTSEGFKVIDQYEGFDDRNRHIANTTVWAKESSMTVYNEHGEECTDRTRQVRTQRRLV